MDKRVYKKEDVQHIQKYVFNGRISNDVDTHDEQYTTIGIVQVNCCKTLDSELYTAQQGIPLAKFMEDELSFSSICNLQYILSDKEIKDAEIELADIMSEMYGLVEFEYNHNYSDYTGYLWTTEKFVVGGHDVLEMLYSNTDRFIHMEIDVYQLKEKR